MLTLIALPKSSAVEPGQQVQTKQCSLCFSPSLPATPCCWQGDPLQPGTVLGRRSGAGEPGSAEGRRAGACYCAGAGQGRRLDQRLYVSTLLWFTWCLWLLSVHENSKVHVAVLVSASESVLNFSLQHSPWKT